MIDSDKSASRCSRMWWKLGTILERKAYEKAEDELMDGAMKAARIADACFWQATGEMDGTSVTELSAGAAA